MTPSRSEALRHEPSTSAGERAAADDRMSPPDVRERLGELYRAHSSSLVRQLARHTGCGETARELAQETFLRFLRLSTPLIGAVEQPEAYLRRISTNLLRDWGRGRTRQYSSEAPQFARESHVDQVAVLESRDTLRRLEAAISRLKPKTRAIFLAHRLDGLSYAEIAELTGLSVKGVEKQMSKAIAKIDRLLDRP